MTNKLLSRAVARATGESLTTIRSRGFSVLEVDVPVSEVSDRLCLSCPGCGRDVQLGSPDDPLPEWAECAACDIAYPYSDDELFLPEAELVCS